MVEQPSLYHVQLLYVTKPNINSAALLKSMQKHCGEVEQMMRQSGFLFFAFPSHKVQYKNASAIPAQCIIAVSDGIGNSESIAESLQQTWDWKGAKQVISKCTASLMINEFMTQGLERKERFYLFRNIVLAVLEAAPCAAIHWIPSQHFIPPDELIKSVNDRDPFFPAVNVRMFNIQNQQPGEAIMDTMGLAALGIPDLQCHFVGLDRGSIARLLYGYAHYLFDKGDVINSGETIQGLSPDQKWKCRHEESQLKPKRFVIDINPGVPFAAGVRD